MDENLLVSNLILGTGGPQPLAGLLGCDNPDIQHLLELDQGYSIYALAIDSGRNLIAAGTRGGTIELLTLNGEIESLRLRKTLSLRQGPPVLSVCFVENSQIASSDMAGGCFLWQPLDKPNNPRQLDTAGGCVCSLLHISKKQLMGLCSDGRLLLWDIISGKITQTINAAEPPNKLALVKLSYWPRHNAVIYPGKDGQLAFYELDSSKFQTHKAHAGEFFTCALSEDTLYTVGIDDCLMKAWRDPGQSNPLQYHVPPGVVAAEVFWESPLQFVLVDQNGQAGIYEIQSDKLVQIGRAHV